MKCSKCGKETVEEDGVSANQYGVGFFTSAKLDVPLIAYVCYSCGYIEFGTDPVAYNKYRQFSLNQRLLAHIRNSLLGKTTPITCELSLTSLAKEINVPIGTLLEFIHGYEEFLNTNWHSSSDEETVTFRIKGTGKNAKIVVDDRRIPPKERF